MSLDTFKYIIQKYLLVNPEQIHLHRRKRAYSKPRKYPHPKRKFRVLDKIITAISVIYPFAALPQIIEIWVYKRVEGVSLITWSLFLILTTFLIAYAYVHKDRRLFVMWSLWTIMYILVIVGILLYG